MKKILLTCALLLGCTNTNSMNPRATASYGFSPFPGAYLSVGDTFPIKTTMVCAAVVAVVAWINRQRIQMWSESYETRQQKCCQLVNDLTIQFQADLQALEHGDNDSLKKAILQSSDSKYPFKDYVECVNDKIWLMELYGNSLPTTSYLYVKTREDAFTIANQLHRLKKHVIGAFYEYRQEQQMAAIESAASTPHTTVVYH